MIQPHSLRITVAIAVALFSLGAPAGLFGQDDPTAPTGEPRNGDLLEGLDDESPTPTSEEEDLLEGFDEGPAPAPEGRTTGEARWWSLSGSFSFGGAYNYQQKAPVPQRGLSRLRPLLRLNLKTDLGGGWDAQASGIAFYDFAYSIKGRDRFSDRVLKQYEEEVEFRELFVRGSPRRALDLQVGRQIVVWGVADFLRVVDVLNPLENREPGLANIEDLRLPIAMTRASYYFGDWSLTGVAVHEIEFNKDPVPGSDFYPLPERNPFPAGNWPPKEDVPSDGGANTEYGAALKGIFAGWDLGFYWAQFYEDSPHLENVSRTMIPDFRLRHSRLTLNGVAADVALGNWLLKGEAALLSGLEFFHRETRTDRRMDLLVGLEYSGFSDTRLAVEAANRHLLDYDPALADPPDETREDLNQYALIYMGDFLHQTLTVWAVLFAFGEAGDDGLLQRYSVEYDVFDAFSVTGGVMIFQSGGSGNPLFQQAARNDRVFFDLKYSF